MAEIRVIKGERTTVSPVGVVQPGRGGVALGRTMEEAGRRIFESAYQFAYKEAVQEGEREAKLAAISARDPLTGEITFPEPPKTLSFVGTKAYESIAQKRFIDSLTLELNEEAKLAAAQNERNPEGFNATYGAYLDTIKKESGQYSGVVESVGLALSKQYQNKLFMDRLDFDEDIAFKKAVSVLKLSESDIERHASAGMMGMATALYQNKRAELDGVVAEYGDKIGADFIPNMDKMLRSGLVRGQVNHMVQRMTDTAPNVSPDAKQPILSMDLNYMAIALEDRTLSNIPENVRARLAKVGFDEKYINSEIMDGLHRTLASNLRTRQGTVQEQYNAEADMRNINANMFILGQGGTLTQSDSTQIVSRVAGINSSQDLLNNLQAILTPPTDVFDRAQWDKSIGVFHELAFKRAGPLPQQAIDLLENIDVVPSEQIPLLVSFFDQATLFNKGGYMQPLARGLKEETMVMYSTLSALQDTVGPDRLPELFAKFGENDRLPSEVRSQSLKRLLGKKTVSEFVADEIDSDASEAEVRFYAQYADDLLLSVGKKKTQQILKRAGEHIFRSSPMLHSTIGRSRFAPERAYPDDATMDLFQEAVSYKLSLADQPYVIGKTAFLVPDPREGSALPVYTFVDEGKKPIIVNGKPLQVGSQYLRKKLADQRNITIQQLRQEAAKAQSLYIKAQNVFDEVYAP